MKKFYKSVLILIILGSLVCWMVHAQQAMKVVEIKIEGNDAISTPQIMENLSFKVGDQVTEEDLKKSAQNIHDMGYFKEVVPNYTPQDEGIIVTFEIIENPKLEKIKITGNQDYAKGFKVFGIKIPKLGTKRLVSDDRILKILEDAGVAEGEVLNTKHLKKGLKDIIAEYENKGYILVDIGQVKPGPTLSIQIVERKIEKIEIKGLETVPEEVAREHIHIPLNQPVKLSKLQETFSDLSNSIYFREMNQSDIEVAPGSKIDLVKMSLHLKENEIIKEPTEINAIKFEGATIYSEKVLESKLGELPQGPVNNYQVLKILKNIHDLYHEDDYILMRLAKEDIEDGVLTMRIYQGEITGTQIEGNTRTKDYVINSAITLKPGDILNRRALAETYQNLKKLGYFKDVKVDFRRSNDEGGVGLIIGVVEKERLGSFNGALSYSQGGLVGKLSLSWKNLYGTGQDISLEYNRGLLGEAVADWNLKYSTHAFFPGLKSTSLTLYQKGPDPKRIGGETSLGYPIGEFTILNLSGKYEHYKEFGEEGEVKESGITGSTSVGITYDDRDDPDFPTQGGIKSIQVEKAGGFVVGPEFTKLNLTLIHHFATWEDQNIAFRAMGGLGFSLPNREKFTLGGVSTVRGFTASDSSERILLLNTEYRIKLIEGATLALFADAGLGKDVKLMESFGAELRAMIPMGLVRLVFAWPIEDGTIKGVKFQFGMGPMF